MVGYGSGAQIAGDCLRVARVLVGLPAQAHTCERPHNELARLQYDELARLQYDELARLHCRFEAVQIAADLV